MEISLHTLAVYTRVVAMETGTMLLTKQSAERCKDDELKVFPSLTGFSPALTMKDVEMGPECVLGR